MKHIVVLLGAIALACVVVAASLLTLMPLEIIVDTNTKGYSWCGDDPIVGLTTPELTDETELITAWKSGANSVKLTIEGRAKFPNCNGVGWHEFSPSRFYYKIYIIDQDHNDWHEIYWRTNFDPAIIHITHPTTGHPGDAQKFGMSYHDVQCPRLDEDGKEISKWSHWVQLGGCGGFTTVVGDALSIEIKDPHVGAIKVEFWVEVGCNWWGDVHTEPRRFQKDEVKLMDGTGEVRIVDEQDVYEEGETITFEVDTGFSGRKQGGDVSDEGWELRIYDAKNNRVSDSSWEKIGDDKRGLEKSYVIPEGSYDPDGTNTWKVELWNTLFDQSERYFFIIGVDMREQIPGLPTIAFDKVSYEMGDTCFVTVVSEPNPLGTNTIYEFFVKAYYGTAGVDYVSNDYPKYISASGGQATFSFRVARGDEYITVEANAFDGPHNQGGLSSETGKSIVWAEDKNPEPDTFTLVVYVRDKNKTLVEGAIVDCGIKTGKTAVDGKISLIGLPQDTYEVTAKKEGVGSGKETVVLDSDKAITIYLDPDADGNGEIPFLAIIVAIVIAGVFAVAAIFVPGGVYVKILVVVLGVALAIVVYFLLGGVI